jgi:hypothetical protein
MRGRKVILQQQKGIATNSKESRDANFSNSTTTAGLTAVAKTTNSKAPATAVKPITQ